MRYGFLIILFFFFLTLIVISEEKTELFIDENLITIKNTEINANCCSTFSSDFSINNNIITITQRDTSATKCKCMCNFDLNYTISQIPPGNYTLIINREENTKFGYNENKRYTILRNKFSVDAQQSKSPLSFEFKQTPCTKSIPSSNIINSKSGVEVIPNSHSGLLLLRFDMKKAGDASIKIINFLGKEVASLKRNNLSEGIQTIYFDLSDIPSGFYIGKLITNTGQNSTFKITWSK